MHVQQATHFHLPYAGNDPHAVWRDTLKKTVKELVNAAPSIAYCSP